MPAIAPSSSAELPSGNSDDLEKSPIDGVLAALGVRSDQGLSAAEAQDRLQKYVPNAFVEKRVSPLRRVFEHFTGPIAYMIEAAAIVSAIIGHWGDFAIIAGLLFFNAALEFWQDGKASAALAALRKGLAPEATVLRDRRWQTVQAASLVPGDVVKVRLGVIVPADIRLMSGDYASIDEAALTGESLPVSKRVGGAAYSGSIGQTGRNGRCRYRDRFSNLFWPNCETCRGSRFDKSRAKSHVSDRQLSGFSCCRACASNGRGQSLS
jgi:H+-transporting ATPase